VDLIFKSKNFISGIPVSLLKVLCSPHKKDLR